MMFFKVFAVKTRDNFTSYLYDALTRDKSETFIDNWLEKGDEISPALIKAIENSHTSIVIFSENYASSKWCLNELNKIMEFKKEKEQIHQTGSCKEAFAKHEGHSMYCKWKAALTEAANLSGWHSQNRTESELLKGIVRDVLKKLAPTYPNQSKRLVGIEKSYEEIESLLRIGSSEVITLGIWGMGGIGKTTLATALYHKLSYDFEGRCFLANVRKKSDKLEDLRNELFSTLLKENKRQLDGFDMSRLQYKSLFIVLDDVSTREQLEKLIEEYDFMGAESRVIVTTRDKHILSTNHKIYQVDKLNCDHSVELFCFIVFGEKKPKQGYEDLSRRVISYCEVVPLALKVLGASLRERNKEAWECELRKLEKFPDMKILNVLKLSYDGLDRPQKDIFLDIACFFKGEERYWVTGLLEAFDFFPTSGIKVLLDKALITISNANQIEMHDLIQEMGQDIVQESEKYPGKRSRLWKHEEVLDVLKYNKGTNDVQGIILDLDKLIGDLYLSSDFLAKMANLRFLKIHKKCRWHDRYNVYLGDDLESLSDKLGCSLKSWPPNFCAEQLVELRMSFTDVKKLSDGVQNLMKLKSIDLSFSDKLVEITDLSKAEKLEKVSLACCYRLRQLHSSTLSLPKLAYLNQKYCRNIENLESNVHSKSVNELTLSHCLSLEKFSVTSYEIKVLSLSNTYEAPIPTPTPTSDTTRTRTRGHLKC
ncbi:TMV resistance protein N [Glycine max]|nr:TMV resistance protein N [Glycine max]